MSSDASVPVASTDRVRRRHAFYVSGFDPQGPAHYHRLYAEEAVKQAAVGGYAIEVGARQRAGPHSSQWRVDFQPGTPEEVTTTVEFLRWDDVVRRHWPRSRWAVMLSALGSTARQVGNGVLWRILKTSWPAFLVLFLPPALVVALVAWAVLTVGLMVLLARHGLAGAAASLALGVSSAVGWIGFARRAEAKVQMAWLMRSTRFILRQARGQAPELEERIDDFGRRVAAALGDEEVDEVLVVGHSSGAMLAVSAAARALAARRGASAGARPPGLSLLTLGECIPMLSFQPEAREFRGELASLAQSDGLDWVDFTAPPDGCCFALVDPTAVCAERASAPRWASPKRLSPRFAQLFEREAYERIRQDKYRCHFQYLMASQLRGAYDYFAITAGPERLSARFAAHASVEGFQDFQLFGGSK
jgi:pimeloyl-ACP methyl ester carboxylesterase